MATDPARRRLLRFAGAAATALAVRPGVAAASPATFAEPAPVLLAGGVRRAEDEYRLAITDDAGALVASLDLPSRAHGIAHHERRGLAVICARRPGTWFGAFRPSRPDAIVRTDLPPDRRGQGHAAFSGDGRWLFATESDFDAARGVLGIYDVADPAATRRIGEIATSGTGPHDVLRIPGSDHYVIANGGIETHPDTGREKLNLATMSPSIVLVHAAPGRRAEVVAELALPPALHRLSLRHLALSADRRLWVGAQDESETPRPDAPLVMYADLDEVLSKRSGKRFAEGPGPGSDGLARTGATLARRVPPRLPLVPVVLPEEAVASLAGYVSSIAAARDGVMVTSSHGGTALLLDARTATLQATLRLGDVSGVAPGDGSPARPMLAPWFLSNGRGEIVSAGDFGIEPVGVYGFAWDNHLARL